MGTTDLKNYSFNEKIDTRAGFGVGLLEVGKSIKNIKN